MHKTKADPMSYGYRNGLLCCLPKSEVFKLMMQRWPKVRVPRLPDDTGRRANAAVQHKIRQDLKDMKSANMLGSTKAGLILVENTTPILKDIVDAESKTQ